MRYFVAVAEELHFGRAALRLHIVQPALSMQVARLEEELGVRLLERTKRQVQLNEAGQVFLVEARAILEAAERAKEAARRAARGQIGRLSIGFVGPAAYSILPDVLRAYRERYPEVELALNELNSTEQVAALKEGRIQVGFVRTPVTDEEIALETVFREPVVVVIPQSHPLAEGKELPLEALAGEPFVMVPRAREPGAHDHYVGLCRQAGFSPRVVQEAHQIHTIVGLVAAGIGVALVPSSVRHLQRPGAVYRFCEGGYPDMELVAARLKHGSSPVVGAFLEVVEDVTGKTKG